MKAVLIAVSIIGFLYAANAFGAEPNPVIAKRTQWFHDAGWGVFTHYLSGIALKGQKSTVDNWNKVVDAFDVPGLVKQLQSVGAKYYVITIGQNSGFYCSPNATYDKFVGIKPSKCSKRDLIADIAAALKPTGIRLMVYLPSGAPDRDPIAMAKLGWKNGKYPLWQYPHGGPNGGDDRLVEFQKKWQAIIREWSTRWGKSVSGWWFDGCYFPIAMYEQPDPPNFASFAAAARAGNPDSIVAFNPGVVNPVISLTKYEDYTAGEINDAAKVRCPGRWVDGAQFHILSFLGPFWAQSPPRYSNEQVVAITRSIIKKGGVVTWDVPIRPSGLIAQPFIDQLKALHEGLAKPEAVSDAPRPDWLVTPVHTAVTLETRPDKHEINLTNGLMRRTFRTAPNLATVDYENLNTDATVIRGVKPEAVVTLNGHPYDVGGLKGQPDYAYLDSEWLDSMTSDPNAFQFTDYTTGPIKAPYPWKPERHASSTVWPPRGLTLSLNFRPPATLAAMCPGLTVTVHYAMYEGIPVLAKWVTVANADAKEVTVDALENEILAVTESEKPRLYIESEYHFAGMNTIFWGPDPDYLTQVDYTRQSPVLLTTKYPLGPGAQLAKGDHFTSFRTIELLYDSDDRERQGLSRRRMMRTLAPQVTENPIFMHVREADPAAVRLAVDQCAATGFEMVIMSFGSGFNIESTDPKYIAQIKADVDYAHAKGIELGGYTLVCASRNVSPEVNCISPKTGKPGSKFGQSACLATAWGDEYFKRLFHFVDATGLDMVETDGPYHGDVCASTKHKYHHGLADSQVAQWNQYRRFCYECRKRGVYINSPDWYYLSGTNKCGMGYRETNFSLPRARQILIARQNIYDGTYDKTPSMGWMFVPLVEYHGGGAAATIEPLSKHLDSYEWYLAQNFGSGVQACYRGPRLYDTDAVKAVVKKWVDFYKKYRTILDSDIIHLRRPDGRGIDAMMHVNSQTNPCGLAMVFNPTHTAVDTTLRLPLYYTGLTDTASVREQENPPTIYKLARDYSIEVPIHMAAKSITYFVVEPGHET